MCPVDTLSLYVSRGHQSEGENKFILHHEKLKRCMFRKKCGTIHWFERMFGIMLMIEDPIS